MKRFKFSLQTVHNVRELQLEKEEITLSDLLAEAMRAEEQLTLNRQMRLEAAETYSRKLREREPLSAYEMEMHTKHLHSLDRSIEQASALVEEKKEAVRIQREVVAAAGKAVKVTERLRDFQEDRHRTELARTEQTDLDEMVSSGFARGLVHAK